MHRTAHADWDVEGIVQLLIECGQIALGHWGRERGQLKSDWTLVTRADHEIEDLLSRRLENPDAGVYLIGEETVEHKGEEYVQRALQETTYVVDPIDGTAPYAHGLSHWGISVGRMQCSRLTDGAIYLPASGELFITRGDGVRLLEIRAGAVSSDTPVRPSPRRLDEQGMIAIGQGIARQGRVRCRNAVQALATAVVPFAYLARGGFAAYVSPLKLWDLAAGLPVVARQGFSVLTLSRQPFDLSVTEAGYFLSSGHPRRWGTRDTLIVCQPGDEATLADCIEVPGG